MAKIGRPMGTKKYTAKAFARACEAYFRSISYEEPVMRRELVLEDNGVAKMDDNGHLLYKYVPVITADKQEAKRTVWTEPPSMQSLYLFLGIDKSTFCRYGTPNREDPDSDSYCETAARARGRVEAYLVARMEEKGASTGVKFNLENNFGWRAKKEVELGDKAKDAVTAAVSIQGMTMAEKIAALKEAGVDVSDWE